MTRTKIIEAMARAEVREEYELNPEDAPNLYAVALARAGRVLAAIEAEEAVVVPMEAKEAMIGAGGIEHRGNPISSFAAIYAAMIAASPYKNP